MPSTMKLGSAQILIQKDFGGTVKAVPPIRVPSLGVGAPSRAVDHAAVFVSITARKPTWLGCLVPRLSWLIIWISPVGALV